MALISYRCHYTLDNIHHIKNLFNKMLVLFLKAIASDSPDGIHFLKLGVALLRSKWRPIVAADQKTNGSGGGFYLPFVQLVTGRRTV